MVNYYEILGIDVSATHEQIKQAFRINAVKYHPDKNSGDPVFTQKFIEIKEAYDILSNPSSKQEYDFKYYQQFGHQDTTRGEKKQQWKQAKEEQRQKEEERFRYNQYKPFYSNYNRDQQETPQDRPYQTPWGEKLSDELEFFILPKKIGKIIGGLSDLTRGENKITINGLTKKLLIRILLIIISTSLLGISHYLYLKGLHKNNPLFYVIVIWTIIASIIIYLLYVGFKEIRRSAEKFDRFNFYIGINGFAFYKFEGKRENITEQIEINFNDVTDFISFLTVNKLNSKYVSTSYDFGWFNRNTNKMVYHSSENYKNQNDNPEKLEAPKYWLNKEAEKYFTIYLLDNMENNLEKNGFIEFLIFPNLPYLRIGIGFITFLKSEDSFTYKYSDIKRMYIKDSNLYLEHSNFEKILFFFKSGNQDSIPLHNLYNRQFFYKAMELLLGYKIV